MQQRRLRLGDILDDYCPRERRITNHAVVAMIDEQVKQTRCTTCEAEHEYKGARVPTPRRRKNGVAAAEPMMPVPPPDVANHEEDVLPNLSAIDGSEPLEDATAIAAAVAADDEPPAVGDDEGPVHRRLIRATLPRPEGQVQDWKEPDFTVRQPGRGRRDFDSNHNGHSGPGQGQRPGRHRRGLRSGSGQSNSGGGQARFGGPKQRPGNTRTGSAPSHPGQRQHGNRTGGNQRGPGRKRGR